MAQLKVTVRLPRRASLFASLISLLAILPVTVEIKAQTRKGTPSGSSQAARKSARQSGKATCDGLAAHPEDKGRTGPGVADEKIVPGPAIEKCTAAVQQSPEVARFQFQLGRAYWAAKRYDEALDTFLKAEEMEYAPAYFYLGLAYEQGLIEGQKADAAAARNLYMIAAAEGFEPAVRAYQESVGDVPDFSEFKQPALLQALYDGNLDTLYRERRTAIAYTAGIHNFLRFGPDMEGAEPSCVNIIDASTLNALRRMARVELLGMNPEPSALGDFLFMRECALQSDCMRKVRENETHTQQGMSDMFLFAYDYGTCEGAAVEKVYTTIKRFVRELPAR